MWDGPEVEPPLILGAAHKLTAAKEILDLSIKTVRRSPVAREFFAKAPMGSGNEHMELTNGSRWRIEASSDDGGRSLSVTDLGFDELRQQVEWDAWSALTNTTNARFSPQTIAVSNAGTGKSVVLRALRTQALARLDEWENFVGTSEQFAAKHDTTLAIFEWSAPDGAAVDDVQALAQANPAVGHPNEQGEVLLTWEMLLSTAALVGKGGDDGVPEHVFRTENMCQWVTAAKDGPFPEDAILACIDNDSEIAEDSPIVLAVDTAHSRHMSYLAVAGWRVDGLPHVEVIAQRAGTEWVAKTVASGLEFDPDGVVLQGRGAPASTLTEYLTDAGVDVTKCEGPELPASCSSFSDRVVAGTIRFRDDSALMPALREGVKKSLTEVWVWSRKDSPVDVAPLCAVTFALWGLERLGKQPVKTSAYGESYGEWWR